MELGNLPLEGIRPIISILDLASLVQLHATNDPRIRKLLSRPGALYNLNVRSIPNISDELIMRFLTTIKDVKHLSIAKETDSSLVRPALLQTLNPQSIELHCSSTTFSESATTKFTPLPSINRNVLAFIATFPNTIHTIHLHLPFNLDLKALMPLLSNITSLQSLTLVQDESTRSGVNSLTFPASLTALKLIGWPSHYANNLSVLNLNASKLVSFTLDAHPNIGFGGGTLQDLSPKLPPTLAHLSINTAFHYSSFPLLLQSLHLTAHELERIDSPTSTVFKAIYLIPQLLHLSISTSSRSDALYLCTAKMEATGQVPNHPYIVIAKLPRSLLSLEIRCDATPLETEGIAELPPGLRSLTFKFFELSRVSELRKVVPACYLSLRQPIELWTSQNGLFLTQNEFAPFWSASFDLASWQRQLRQWRNTNKVSFSLNFRAPTDTLEYLQLKVHFPSDLITLQADSNDGSSIPWEQVLAFDLLSRDCPQLVQIDANLAKAPKPFYRLPESLTSLDLQNTPLPPRFMRGAHDSLEFLVASSVYEDPGLFPNDSLTHLDTPNWTFEAEDILKWDISGFDVLNCSIRGMPDFEVIPFLKAVADSCTEAALSISYFVTGHLLSHPSADPSQNITWALIKSETDKILNKIIHAPTDVDSAPLASIVTSLTQSNEVGRGRAICIPKSAVTVSLDLETEFYWASGLTSSKETGAFSAKSRAKGDFAAAPVVPKTRQIQKRTGASKKLPSLYDSESDEDYSAPTAKYVHPFEAAEALGLAREAPRFGFGFALSTISLFNVTNAEEWLTNLPSTLRSLHFTTSVPLGTLKLSFPPNLAKLVIETLSAATSAQALPFKLSSIPSSIEYICISSQAMVPHKGDQKPNQGEITPIRVPLLKTFYLSQPSLSLVHKVCSTLNIHPEGRIIVEEMHETPLKDQRNNPSFGLGTSSHQIVKDLIDQEQLVLDTPGRKSVDDLLLAEISALSIQQPSSFLSPSKGFASVSPSKGFGSFAPSSSSTPSTPISTASSIASPPSGNSSTAPRRKAVRAPRK